MSFLNNFLFGLILCICSVAYGQSSFARYGKAGIEKGNAKKLVTIYENSMPAVMGMATYNDTLELLLGTYLTDTKDDSIWPKVIEETKAWFGEEHEREPLEAMEKRLKNYRLIIEKCHEENTGKELTKCLSVLRAEFTSGEGDFLWDKEQEVPLFLNFYEAFHLMKLASLQLIKIQKEKDNVPGINIDLSIQNEAKEFSKTLLKSVEVACEQRIQRITAVNTCKVVDILWQEYTDICEERLKRSVSEDEESSGDDENDDQPNSRSDVTQEEIQQSRIGGNQSDFTESIRAMVKDRATKQYVYNKRLTVSPSMNKAKLVEKLYNEGIKARGDHVKRVEKACNKYWEEHGSKIAKQVSKLANMPKKKAKKTKKNKNNGQ